MITEEQLLLLEEKGIDYFKKLLKDLDDNDYWTILRALWIDNGIVSDEWEKLIF